MCLKLIHFGIFLFIHFEVTVYHVEIIFLNHRIRSAVVEWKVEGEDAYQTQETQLPHRLQLAEITESIRMGVPSLVNGREALKALQVVEAIYKSAETGKPEKVCYE